MLSMPARLVALMESVSPWEILYDGTYAYLVIIEENTYLNIFVLTFRKTWAKHKNAVGESLMGLFLGQEQWWKRSLLQKCFPRAEFVFAFQNRNHNKNVLWYDSVMV